MKRTVITAVLLLAGAAGANATSLDSYREQIRPHGHARSDAVFQAALDACYAQTGASRFHADTPGFRQCMLGRGYRWRSVQHVPTPRVPVEQEPDVPPIEPSYEQPVPQVTPQPVIDPITGEVHPG